jgi:NADH-quinone oxidoreductase subunit G
MPTVTIDGRTIEVERGTNLIDAAVKAGVQIPHYCYHPRLSVVGQCRMCLVKVEGMPVLQPGCTTQVHKDGMVVLVDDPEVKEAQEGIMEFLLINHPLDCPICDQAGECGLQDYSFKHGQAFSRFRYEEKRTYPGKERIPLGPDVLLNMNRCIQCTRCVRFTAEVSKTGELGFFERGARAEIGVFSGRQLDNPLAGNVVDICPVGALTSTRFRFAERVWYLDKKPSICTGCDVGCNITLEHRRGTIRRYKPRFNPEVNDYWMCDYGRSSFERYAEPRLTVPATRQEGELRPCGWKEALAAVVGALREAEPSTVALLATGNATTEEAFLLAELGAVLGSPSRAVLTEAGTARSIPLPGRTVTGSETTPNRRGAELAGLRPGPGGWSATDLVDRDAAAGCTTLVVVDGEPGSRLHEPQVVGRLRQAHTLVVAGWAETPLSAAADVVLPTLTHAEKDGTFVNVERRLQRFSRAFPAASGARPTVAVLGQVLESFVPGWRDLSVAEIFARMAGQIPALDGLELDRLPASGVALGAEDSEV